MTGDVLTKLKTYLTGHITEKPYLQFDKPYYAAGDTIYFKAYVTMGERHDLSQISGVLHIDLINTKNKIDQSLLLKLTDGVAWGDFSLPDSLPKGEYRVRAYTNWMRNGGDERFFEQVIPVGSAIDNKVPESGTGQPAPFISKPDVQFFPEGGNLVAGISAKIAFKAIGINGLGMDIRGDVIDNTGKTVTTFASTHLGMGCFYLRPEEGKSYKANLIFADGSQNTIPLPAPAEPGMTLTVNNDSLQKTTVVIQAGNAYFQKNKGKEYKLLIHSGGVITAVNYKLDSALIKLDLVKRRLYTGVNMVTLFSQAGEPLAERLFFIQNYDQLNIAVNSDKTTYAAREKINVKLNVKNRADSAVAGHFSISVIDEGKVPIDENDESTILSNLLLTAELKGNVEQPNYYFNNITDEKLKNLDLVMLTHGYRGFEWKQVLDNSYLPLVYQPEKHLEVEGVAQNLSGKPLANATISLIPPAGGPVLSENADDKGNFKFRNMEFMDSTRFILQAVNAKESNKTQLAYIQNKNVPPIKVNNWQRIQDDTNEKLKIYITNAAENREHFYTSGLITGKMLSEVEIKAHKFKPIVHTSRYGVANYEIKKDDIISGGFLSDRLDGRIPGVRFVPTRIPGKYLAYKRVTMSSPPKPIMIVVDDQEMPAGFDINSISTSLIDKIEVVTNATVGTNDTEGAILITLLHGTQLKDIPSFGILPITARGYYKAKVFYSPKYDNIEANVKRKDLRSTIYWNPELVTDDNGNAAINYYNADGLGTYRMVIEGIDEKGNIGRRVYRYTIK